jgi:N-acetylglucosaminyl-diphospho-decaprenol L-rhamnosyltransferase
VSPVHEVSVVVVTWKARDAVVACVDSIAAHPSASPWEAIVVDNASHDGTVEALSGRDRVRVLVNESNRGLSAANNQGMVAATGDVIVISNPDVEYSNGSIDSLVACLERHPRAAFVFAHILRPDGSSQTSAGDLPSLRDALLGRQVARHTAGGRSGFWWDGWAHDEECEIGHGLEACYAVRRAALEALGPQDERFPLDWEGIDWCARAHEAGWEVWFCPSATVVHTGGVSIRQAQLRWVIASHRGMYRCFAKRSSFVARPLLALAFGARAAAKAVGVAVSVARYERSHPGSGPR